MLKYRKRESEIQNSDLAAREGWGGKQITMP